MTSITRVEVHVFGFDVADLALPSHGAAGVGNVIARKGGRMPMTRYAVSIDTADGARGEYVTHWVGTPGALGQTLMLAPHLVGRDPDAREQIWDDLKREIRAYDHMGHGPLDIALWDLAGKRLGCGIGAFDRQLPDLTAHLCEHLSRPGRAGRAGYARGVRRLCRRMPGAGFPRLQDPWLARWRCEA